MVIVTISESGKKLLAEIGKAQFMEAETIIGNKLSEAEALELGHLLDKFRE